MSSKKQRKRRQKERRHEYEYVYVDEEGQEVEVEEPQPARPAGKGSAAKTPARGGRVARGGRAARKVEPPSWRRVGRRALVIGPVLVAIMFVLPHKNVSIAALLAQALFFLLVFLPFSYMMDSMMYRSYLKRTGQPLPERGRRAKEPKTKA